MQIVSLQYKKRRGGGGEVIVELSNGANLALDADIVVRFQLKRGMSLKNEELAHLEQEQTRLAARRRLIHHLSLRRKTVREAENYLRQLKFPEDAVQMAVTAAREQGYLDDAQYTLAYVRSRERSAKKGPRAIFHELAARGIATELADKALAQSREPETQLARAMEVGRKKLRTLQKEQPRIAHQKLARFLLAKGYDGDIAFEVTRQLTGESEDEP